jgi:hypothetical protein
MTTHTRLSLPSLLTLSHLHSSHLLIVVLIHPLPFRLRTPTCNDIRSLSHSHSHSFSCPRSHPPVLTLTPQHRLLSISTVPLPRVSKDAARPIHCAHPHLTVHPCHIRSHIHYTPIATHTPTLHTPTPTLDSIGQQRRCTLCPDRHRCS